MHIGILYGGRISRSSGTDERVLQIVKELSLNNIQVTFSAAIENQTDNLDLNGINHVLMPLYNVKKIHNILFWMVNLIIIGIKKRYDIIQIEVFSLPEILLLFFVLRPFANKFIIVFHDKWFINDPRISIEGKVSLFLHRIILSIFDYCITPGSTIKQYFMKLHGENVRQKICIIPNGSPSFNLEHEVSQKSLRSSYLIDENAFVALYFGSMNFKPNYDSAMKLFEISEQVCTNFKKQTGKNLVFVVAGIYSQLLPKNKYFVPVGYVKSLSDLFTLPDLIVIPHLESHSGPHIKTIYAFLSKKPVVCTEDAIKDMAEVKDKEQVLLFQYDDPESLLKVITSLYFNHELGETISLNAYLYTKKYSWKYVSSLHLNLYHNLLKR